MIWKVWDDFKNLDILVDIRPSHQYIESHIPKAVSVPFQIDLKQLKADHGSSGIHLHPTTILPYISEYESFRDRLRNISGHIGIYDQNGGWRSILINKVLPFLENPVQLRCVPCGQRELAGKLGRLQFLKGGFIAYKTQFYPIFQRPLNFVKISGGTGSGKTKVLRQLGKMGAQILDLEKISRHSGSAFGGLTSVDQPSQWEFECRLAREIKSFNLNKIVFVEQKGSGIGSRHLPESLAGAIDKATSLYLEVSKEDRVKNIIAHYGHLPKALLQESIITISPRLGSENSEMAIEHLNNGNRAGAVDIILQYYDKTVGYQRVDPPNLAFTMKDPEATAKEILRHFHICVLNPQC